MEEPNPIKAVLRKHRAAAIFAAWILTFSCTVFASGANQDAWDAKIDYGMAQQDILRFEMVINGVLNSTFSSSPFAVVQKAKGAYLPGYGISLSFLINIHRAVINTPFGQVVRSGEGISPELKKRRIEELKEKLIRVLQENGDSFRQLRNDDYVTVVGFFEDRNIPDEPNANKTIVLSVFKKDLDELGHKAERFKEFRQRMKIVEY